MLQTKARSEKAPDLTLNPKPEAEAPKYPQNLRVPCKLRSWSKPRKQVRHRRIGAVGAQAEVRVRGVHAGGFHLDWGDFGL